MAHRNNRRNFLGVLGALGAAPMASTACGGGSDAPHAALAPTEKAADGRVCGIDVVVLGAGLAGLAAAYVLMQAGRNVTVLEAQHRVGGRVLTERKGLKHGFHAEMGAARVFETHAYTQKYVKLFQLSLVPYDSGERAYHLRGQRFAVPPAGQPWPVADMTEAERANPEAFLPRYVLPGFAQLGDMFDAGWPNDFASALALDEVTVEGFMRRQGASSGWIDWFCAREGNIKRTNACAALASEAASAGTSVTSIAGGNDRLPEAFAAALGRRIELGCKVVRIAQDDEGVTIGLRRHGQTHEIRARQCVCALPFSTMRDVVIETPFADDKMAAIRDLRYMAAARCYFQTTTRFWESSDGEPLGPLGGLNLVASDTTAGRIWNTSSQQPDSRRGLIHSYMFDIEALEYASMGRDRERHMRRHVETRLLPGLQGQVIASCEKVWQEDPWVRGGWGWTRPNEMRTMHLARKRPEGRVHFAGEHTSVFAAWMNGAIESGERAAAEILRGSANAQLSTCGRAGA